ncbi:Nn.00g101550.m01.CDS01 [Neocucurbitaria sp. VM-36]
MRPASEPIPAASPEPGRDDNDPVGREAVLNILGGFLVLFTVWGLPISFGAFQLFYVLEYIPQFSPSTISWIGTTQGFFLITTGLISGPLFDFGYFRTVMWFGTLLTTFGLMMQSLADTFYQLLLSQGVCVGIGCGLLYLPSLSLLGTRFKQRRATAMGIATAGIGVGGICYTLAFQRLIQTTTYGWTTRALGLIALFSLIIAMASFGKVQPRSSVGKRTIFDPAAMKNQHFLLFAASQFFVFLGYIVPLICIPTMARVGFRASNKLSTSVLLLTHATSAIGRLFAAVATFQVPIMPLWITSCVISGVLCFACIRINSIAGFWAFAGLYGFFTGAVISLPPSIFPRLCPDPTKVGTWMGMSWSGTGIAYLIGTPAAAALIKLETANFVGALAWSGGMLIGGSVFLCVLWYKLPPQHAHTT